MKDDHESRVERRQEAKAEHTARAKGEFAALVAHKHATGERFSQANLAMVPDALLHFEQNTPSVPGYPLEAKLAEPRAQEALAALKTSITSIDRSIASYEQRCNQYDEQAAEAERLAKKAMAAEEAERVAAILARRGEEDALLAKAERTPKKVSK
jgi:hypothetical protein